jgi:hypothetical protein
MANDFGYSYGHMQQSDLQSMLLSPATEFGAVICPGSTIVEFRSEVGQAKICLRDGTRLSQPVGSVGL